MSAVHTLVAFLVLQRVVELGIARRNTRRLRAAGGIEVGAGHYPAIVALHVAWLAAITLGIPGDAPVSWPLLAAFAVLQGARVWVIGALGPYWTTRIITLPGRPLVRRGPYALARHPNYLIVAAEIAVVPLIFGAWEIAVGFSILNAAVLRHRIRAEDAVLDERRHPAPASGVATVGK
jgi:methyltransferase